MSNDEVAPGATPLGDGSPQLPVPTQPGPLAAPAPSGSWDLDLAAASLRMDTSDTDQLFQALGEKLERILGRRVQVRRGGGLRRRQRVEKISVDGGENRLEAVQGRSGPVFMASHAVRGIVLQSSEVSAEDWLERLVALVGAESARSSDVRSALGGLLE